jgi:hypothetical protein
MPDNGSLPNLDPGHIDGCTTRAVYSEVEDTPPVMIVMTCAEGCPHQSVELART